MRKNFGIIYRGFLVLVCGMLLWSGWRASAQETNQQTSKVEVSASVTSTDDKAEDDKEKEAMNTPQWVERLALDFPFLKRVWWGNELWKYISSFIYIFLAFYVSKLLDFLTRVWLKKLAAKSITNLDDLILDLLNGPVKIVAFVIFLRIGLNLFDWPEIVQNGLSYGFTVIVAITITYMAMKMIDLLMNFWRSRAKEGETDRGFDEQLFPIIRKSLKVFIIVVAALVTLDNIGVNITAAIASLSIGGLAVGLAAQDTLANLFGAVAIFMDKPFRVGDRVQVEGIDGPVESIGLRSTRVRNLDGHLITIPNKTMANANVSNITARPNIKSVMNIGIKHDTPMEKMNRALAVLNEIYKSHANTGDVWVCFDKFTESSFNILVIHWWNNTDYKAYLDGMQEMNLKIKERFDAEGISFAFPSRTIYLKQDSELRIGTSTDGNGAASRVGATQIVKES